MEEIEKTKKRLIVLMYLVKTKIPLKNVHEELSQFDKYEKSALSMYEDNLTFKGYVDFAYYSLEYL